MSCIIALTGIHSSGKSTLGGLLRQEGLNYHLEVAKQLIDSNLGSKRVGGGLTEDAFQRLIMDKEIAREKTLSATEINIIETYHIGNLAHCYELASPDTIKAYENYLQLALAKQDVHCMFLDIDYETMRQRSELFKQITPSILEFYMRIRENIFQILDKYDVPNQILSNRTADELTKNVRRIKEISMRMDRPISSWLGMNCSMKDDLNAGDRPVPRSDSRSMEC